MDQAEASNRIPMAERPIVFFSAKNAFEDTKLSITPSLCQRCGACCSVVVDGELVACRHLDTSEGSFRCRIYSARPQVCRDFSCIRDGRIASPAIADRVLAAMKEAS